MSETEIQEIKLEHKKLDLKLKDKEKILVHEYGMLAIKIGMVLLAIVCAIALIMRP